MKEKGRFVMSSRLSFALPQPELKTPTDSPRDGPWKPGPKGRVVGNSFLVGVARDKRTVTGGP